MNVNPNTNLRIVRQLSDPTDVGTNYVRAVVRNSATGAVLDTVDLTDEGSQRFSGYYHTDADPSGVGYYIDVTTTVYTDAGYTTKSENYQIETNTYHVVQQWGPGMGLGGGGVDVNYDKVRRIVQEELGKLNIEIPTPRDLTPELLGLERRIKESVGAIKIPEQKEVDLEPVMQEVRSSVDNAINTLLLAVDNKEVTPPTDLTALQNEVRSIKTEELAKVLKEAQSLREVVQQVLDEKSENESAVAEAQESAIEFVKKLSGKQRERDDEPSTEEVTRARARKLLGV